MKTIRDQQASLEADYFSKIQYPIQWIEIRKDLKQDVNSARRESCYQHHAWGFKKGWDAAIEYMNDSVKEQKENK